MSEEHKYTKDENGGAFNSPSQIGEVVEEGTTRDAVFGDIGEGGPDYRNVGWIGTTALMLKTQIGLGVLSMPAVFDVLGVVPGVILLCVIGGITSWSDWMVGVFKLKHRHVYGIDDVGEMLFGRIGREFFSVAFCLFFIFVSGSAMISISIALNALSTHAVCTAVFVVVAAIIGFMFCSIQTLSRISWLAWVGVACIITAVFTVTIAVGLQDRPSAAPQEGVWKSDYKIVNHPKFTDAVAAISSMIFSYAGTPGFFSIAAEMLVYITVGVVMYYYCGSYVASPAIGSAGPLLKKVGYGIGLPGLIASLLLLLHLPAKFIFVRLLRGSKHLTSNSVTHWATWLGCTAGCTLIAYLIASGIPVFGSLVSLIGALLGTLLSFQPMGCMWLYDNWAPGKQNPTMKWRAGVAWSVFVIISGTFLMVAGTYSSVVGIINDYKASGGSAAWSCADNSNST